MNELMQALEALVRRIVQEELARAASVRSQIEDQPWFDDLITSEVMRAIEDSAPVRTTLFTDEQEQKVRELIDSENGSTDQQIRNVVREMRFSVEVD